jgi:hypothetical protein
VRLADLGRARQRPHQERRGERGARRLGWDGEGLDVETSNGGVKLAIPEPYNAQLDTRTVNGGFRFDYPLTLTGELSPRRGITTTIGAGGPRSAPAPPTAACGSSGGSQRPGAC